MPPAFVPMKLPARRLPDDPPRARTPSSALPEIRLPASIAQAVEFAPPIELPEAAVSRTPLRRLPIAAEPSALVPM